MKNENVKFDIFTLKKKWMLFQVLLNAVLDTTIYSHEKLPSLIVQYVLI